MQRLVYGTHLHFWSIWDPSKLSLIKVVLLRMFKGNLWLHGSYSNWSNPGLSGASLILALCQYSPHCKVVPLLAKASFEGMATERLLSRHIYFFSWIGACKSVYSLIEHRTLRPENRFLWHRRQTGIQVGILQGVREMGRVRIEANWKAVVY